MTDVSRDYLVKPWQAPVDFQIDYAAELNAQQHAAVTAPPGPALVIAGAGAGKTRTLVFRVAYLLEQGIPEDRILLLTFTNKSAREMMRRVTELLGTELTDLWGGTFHSIGHRILRRHADLVGWRNSFSILDREDARDLLKACMADADLETGDKLVPKADVLYNIISMALNTRKSIAEVLAGRRDYSRGLAVTVTDLAARYQDRKRQANVMDFDDLLILWERLLAEQPAVLEYYQRQFQFILVDEYQDTNLLQSELVDQMAAQHQNLMVVGDDSQSIYSWRGANFQNILHFPKRYPKAQVFKIETNYRSTPEILELANHAIKPNAAQFPKELAPVRSSGSKPVLAVCRDTDHQSAFIAQRVTELREEGVDMNRMAVLYRAHFHALELQLELTRRQIPFSITSGIRFFEQAHIKDVTSYLKVVANPDDELAFKRVVQLLPGIGAKGADKLWVQFHAGGSAGAPVPGASDSASKTGLNAEPATTSSPETGGIKSPVATACQRCLKSVPAKAAKAWTNLAITFSQLEDPKIKDKPGQMIELVLEASYKEYLEANFANYESRLEDLQQLGLFALNFASTQECLSQLSLLSNLEAESDRPDHRNEERLRLSTIHQAKGLEFDVVFVIMLCEGLFPNARTLEREENLEEERRLFYVAITRARNELYLSYPLMRHSPGEMGFVQDPSRFLGELPKALIDEWGLR